MEKIQNIANKAIKEKAKLYNVCLWQLADYFNVSEMTINRRLRHELSSEKAQEWMQAIETISAESRRRG